MRLIEVLEGDFPAVKGALGESAFARVASRYVADHPSRSPSLRWYGRDFPAFLLDDAAPRSETISELARFEWLQGENTF